MLAFVAFFVLAGCVQSAHTSPARHRPAQRIVSLMPSLTEDLCAIGAQKQLAGVSAYSQDIPCARGVVEVNNFSSVNAERIVALRADAVLAIPAQRTMTAPLVRAGVPVYYISDDSFGDIFTSIAEAGRISGRERAAQRLIDSLRRRTAQLRRRAHFRHVPSVLFVEQAVPLWSIGPQSYIASLIRLAGGRIATAALPQAYGRFSEEAMLAADPDAIVATGDARVQDALPAQPWRSLRAVRAHHVFIQTDSALLVRPGPRYNQGLQWLIARFSSL